MASPSFRLAREPGATRTIAGCRAQKRSWWRTTGKITSATARCLFTRLCHTSTEALQQNPGEILTSTSNATVERRIVMNVHSFQASPADIQRGVLYHQDQLKTSPVPFAFRPSRREDVPIVDELPAAERQRYLARALASLAAGEGVMGALAAGQSSRMNPKLAPSDVQELVQRMYGTPRELESKAAVPIGVVDEQVITFLGA